MDNPLMFPTTHNMDGNAVIDGGITLRDHFAGLAMQAFINNDETSTFEIISSDAYTVADAMLKARKEVKP